MNNVQVVVYFHIWLKIYSPLWWQVSETEENKIQTKDKTGPQHISVKNTHKKNVENCGTDHIGGSRKNIIEREIKIDWTDKRNVNEKRKKQLENSHPLL